MTAQTLLATRSLRAEFSSFDVAANYRDNCVSPSKWAILMGDNNRFWVMSNREASILVKAGFEYAEA